MPPNTKKCCEKPKRTTSVSTRKGRRSICNNCGADWVFENTPSLDKSEHDGTCRTPECYEKRPTPAVEDWEGVKEAMRGFLKFPDEETANNWAKFTNSFIRSLLKSDRKRIVEAVIEDYSSWLDKNGYMDSDWYTEEPRATEAYLKSKSYQALITNLK